MHRGAGPVMFIRTTPVDVAGARGAGAVRRVEVRETDDLLDPLRFCFRADDGWLEYGVVEHRLRTTAPQVFARHVREAWHVVLGPPSSTASGVRFAMALRRLADAGELEG